MTTDSTQEKLAIQDNPVLSQVFYVPTIGGMNIHQRIHLLRTKKDLSMEALAERVGVSWQTVQQWEKEDGTAPKRTRLQKVAQELDTTPEYLLNGTSAQSSDWPFDGVEADQYSQLPKDDRDEIESIIKMKIQRVLRNEPPKIPVNTNEFAGKPPKTIKKKPEQA